MNKRLSGMLFGTMLLVYGALMTISYTSCNSDNSNDKVSATPATDSSNMTATDTTKMASAKKAKKGKATIAPSANNTKSAMVKDKDGVYKNPQTMPEYPGGETALSQYMESNLNYPQNALDDNKVGTVNISFVIDENGNVMAPAVIGNKLGDGLDEEAIDLIKKMPKWKPGTVKGKKVKTRLDLPINFQIAAES